MIKESVKVENTFLDLGKKVMIKVKQLKPGTKLIAPVYAKNGSQIHPAYTPFTQEKIDELIAQNIETVYYIKPQTAKPKYADANIKTYVDGCVYQGPRTITLETQKKAIDAIDNIISIIKDKQQQLDFNESRHVIDRIFHEMSNTDENFINLLAIQIYDDYTYTHSLNVGIISMFFAQKMGLTEEEIKNIGLGGFLHDIGKMKIPHQIINKKDRLTDQEFKLIKKHPKFGYEIIKKNISLPKMVKEIILLHHEKFDGQGYPIGLEADQLNDYISIVSISDVYDALTTKRPYKKAFSAQEAFNMILKESSQHFEAKIVHLFVNNVKTLFKEDQYYSPGCYVLLNTHEIAKVVSKDNDLTSRPGVEIHINHYGRVLKNPFFVNLNLDGSRHIVKTIDISLN